MQLSEALVSEDSERSLHSKQLSVTELLGQELYPEAQPKKRSRDQREEMIEEYLPFVRLVAERVHRRLPPGVDLESLIHSGTIGLLEALKRYDPRRGVTFRVYARYRIHGEVMEYLRSLDWVGRSVRAWGRKVATAHSRLTRKLGREVNAEEMAAELDVSLERYYQINRKVSKLPPLSFEDLSFALEKEWKQAQEELSRHPFQDPLDFLEEKDLLQKLTSAIEELPERERLIVTLYYHEELTLREIAGISDLSEGRICQIYARAVSRLKQALET